MTPLLKKEGNQKNSPPPGGGAAESRGGDKQLSHEAADKQHKGFERNEESASK